MSTSLMRRVDLVAVACAERRRSITHCTGVGGRRRRWYRTTWSARWRRLRAGVRFHADDAELAIESDPRTLSDEMIARIGKLGFTRASFGVQEFDPKVQAAINRVQPPDMVRARG